MSIDNLIECSRENGAKLVRHYVAVLRLWRARTNERAFLAGLQEFELKEFGLTRQSRQLEVNKPFWRE